MADLQYTAYRIEAQAKNFEKATEKIHHYIYLTDSLTRSNMQFSAGMVERDYFKERSELCRIPDEEPYYLGDCRSKL